MAFSGWRPWIESALVLNLSHMQKRGAVTPNSICGGTWSWCNSDGEHLYSVYYYSNTDNYCGWLNLSDNSGTYRIELSSTPVNFGGRRWWMHCPLTGRKALKLYRWGAIGRFCHRTAVRPKPTYASQRVSGLDRIMTRRWALRRKLNDPGDLFCPLNKPKWMRWRTFERYAALDDRLGALEDDAILSRWGHLLQVSQLI